jgi:hypothetical protein
MFPTIRRKKIFSGDLKSSTIPTNLNSFTRIGRIVSVDPAKGVCRLQWLDRPGFREGVLLTQGSDGEWNIPRTGAVVLVTFDVRDQARIVRYVNVGHSLKTDSFELPSLSEGEKFWECAGASLYITANGDIILRSAALGTVSLEKSSDTFKSDTTNWRVLTVGGDAFWGQVKRFKTQSDGTKASEIIANLTGDTYIEYTFNLFETSGDRNSPIPGNPLIAVTLGTVIDDSGKVVDENGTPILDDTQSICLQFSITKDSNEILSFKINKQGNVTTKLPKLVLNNGGGATDVTINNGTKGVARLDDEVTVTAKIGDIQVDPGTHKNISPITITGKITKSSSSVKVGD